MVRVVGIDVASESTSGSGESSALDGLLDEEGSRGRAGEGGGARARGAADKGGDGHGCGRVWVVGEVVRGYRAELRWW